MGKVFSREAVYHVEIADGRTVDIAVDLEHAFVRVEGSPHTEVVVSASKNDRFILSVRVMPNRMVNASLHRTNGPWWFDHQAPRLSARISPPAVQVWASVHDIKGNEQIVGGARPLVEEPAGASKPS